MTYLLTELVNVHRIWPFLSYWSLANFLLRHYEDTLGILRIILQLLSNVAGDTSESSVIKYYSGNFATGHLVVSSGHFGHKNIISFLRKLVPITATN